MCVCFIKVSLAPATIIGCHLLRLLRGGRRRRRRPTRPVRALLDRQTKAVAPLVNHARSSAKRPRPEAQVERARVQHSREPGDLRRRALPGPTQSGQRIETNGNCARSLPRVHALKSKRRHTSARCAICYGSSKSAPADLSRVLHTFRVRTRDERDERERFARLCSVAPYMGRRREIRVN